jgi:hypothetical protein
MTGEIAESRRERARTEARIGAQEATDVGPKNQDGREAQRVGPQRGRQLPSGEVRDGVPEAAAGAEREAEGVEGAEADQVRPARVHRGHDPEPYTPEQGFERQPPPPPPQNARDGPAGMPTGTG